MPHLERTVRAYRIMPDGATQSRASMAGHSPIHRLPE